MTSDMSADDTRFLIRTVSELTRLVSESRTERRYVAHRICADEAPCRHCAAIRDNHRLIDDHLDQIELAAIEADLEAVE